RSPVLDRLLCFHAPRGAFLGYGDFPGPRAGLGMVKDGSTLPRADGTDQHLVTHADAALVAPGDRGTSPPVLVRARYSVMGAAPGDTVRIEEAVHEGGHTPIAVGSPPPAGAMHNVRIPDRERDPAGIPETRRYRVVLLDENGVVK